MPNSFIYPLIMLLAGIGIPLMATLNSNLSVKLGSTAFATVIVFFVGLLVSVFYMLQVEGVPSKYFPKEVSWYLYLGGSLVAFYILSITWVAPKFGIGNAVSFVLLGQLVAISLIDHFGLLGARQTSMDINRVMGLIFMTVGVFLVVKRN